MNETYNTRSIVLQYRPWREWDRLYTIYTETHGKIVARAHGIRRPRAKLAGSLEPFAEIDLYCIRAKQFHKIGGAVVRQRFDHIRTDIPRYAATTYCCEVIDRLTHEYVPDPPLYQLLYTTLLWLDQQPPSRLIAYSFVVKCVAMLGYDIAATVPNQPEIQKIIHWLKQQPYSEIQKVRWQKQSWQHFTQTVRGWLREYLSSDVQSERFLVY